MKLEAIVTLLGLLHVICAVPTLTESSYEPQPSYVHPQFLESHIQNADGGPDDESYEKEITKYFETHSVGQLAFRNQQVEVEGDNGRLYYLRAQICITCKVSGRFYMRLQCPYCPYRFVNSGQYTVNIELTFIRQGDTIALQTYRRDHWLTCWNNKCNVRVGCTGAFWSAADWKKCSGEVFQIFSSQAGEIKSGDLVGIHYPHEKGRWFSCWDKDCDKDGCPGSPTTKHGFNDADKWYKCHGEVFRIYVYGKADGDEVTSGDLVALYYIREQTWVNGGGQIRKNKCIGSTPPKPSQYDLCSQEIFTIIKKP